MEVALFLKLSRKYHFSLNVAALMEWWNWILGQLSYYNSDSELSRVRGPIQPLMVVALCLVCLIKE